ncbi:hypothetical protein IKG07_01745 [Candidatus Saccharibacteria bacterium]|nr:hypothetical protein [Candidatus Saccharibacteria bacterium]
MLTRLVRNNFVKTVLFSVPLALLMGGGCSYADSVDYIVNVAPSLNITLSSNNVILDLNPNTKTSDSKDLNIKVSTNNMTGYQLTMSSTGDATDLVRDNTVDGKNAVIPTLSAEAGSTAASLTDNTWGYKKDSGNFIPYVSGTKLLENKYATNLDETTLSFGSKINYNQAAGSYELGLVLTGVTNPMMYYMQNMNPSYCTTDPIQVLDIRDMQEYTIQRLGDGNCWLLDNLRLGAVELTEPLSTANTNMSPSVAFALPESTTFGHSFTEPQLNADFANTTVTSYGAGSGKNGVYYNYCAATAGTYCTTTSSGNAQYDICPAGWRMPTGGASGEYQALANIYTGTTASNPNSLQYNLSTAFGGTWDGDTKAPSERNTRVDFFSSTRYSNTNNAYRLYVTPTSVTPQHQGRRDNGFMMRCVLNETIADITYMQDINSSIVANTATGATKVLKDKRDNQEYTVAKQSDGSLWMIDELNLDLTDQDVVNTLNEQNTNANSASIAALKSGGGSGTNGLAVTGLTYSNWASGTSYTQPLARISGTCTTSSSYPCTYNGPYNKDSIISDLTPGTSAFGIGNGKIGVQYNYCAASAGSYCYNSNATTPTTVQYDICPSKWHMPTEDELKAVCAAIRGSACSGTISMTATSASSVQYQLSLNLTGAVGEDGGTYRQGTYHFMGLASRYSNSSMYRLYSSSTALYFGSYSVRTAGYSLRCIVK